MKLKTPKKYLRRIIKAMFGRGDIYFTNRSLLRYTKGAKVSPKTFIADLNKLLRTNNLKVVGYNGRYIIVATGMNPSPSQILELTEKKNKQKRIELAYKIFKKTRKPHEEVKTKKDAMGYVLYKAAEATDGIYDMWASEGFDKGAFANFYQRRRVEVGKFFYYNKKAKNGKNIVRYTFDDKMPWGPSAYRII